MFSFIKVFASQVCNDELAQIEIALVDPRDSINRVQEMAGWLTERSGHTIEREYEKKFKEIEQILSLLYTKKIQLDEFQRASIVLADRGRLSNNQTYIYGLLQAGGFSTNELELIAKQLL